MFEKLLYSCLQATCFFFFCSILLLMWLPFWFVFSAELKKKTDCYLKSCDFFWAWFQLTSNAFQMLKIQFFFYKLKEYLSCSFSLLLFVMINKKQRQKSIYLGINDWFILDFLLLHVTWLVESSLCFISKFVAFFNLFSFWNKIVCVCVSLLSIQILRLCVCYGADFVMEKGKSESSERSFGESDSVVPSQSDIQVKNHLTN